MVKKVFPVVLQVWKLVVKRGNDLQNEGLSLFYAFEFDGEVLSEDWDNFFVHVFLVVQYIEGAVNNGNRQVHLEVVLVFDEVELNQHQLQTQVVKAPEELSLELLAQNHNEQRHVVVQIILGNLKFEGLQHECLLGDEFPHWEFIVAHFFGELLQSDELQVVELVG